MKNNFDARKRNLGTKPVKKVRRWRRIVISAGLGIALLAAVIIGFIIWYSLTHVTTTRAEVSASTRQLSSDVDARLKTLYVSYGQKVNKGDILARLDDSALQAALSAAKAEHAIRQSQLAQAKANARMVEAQVAADIELAEARITMAEKRVESAQVTLEMRKENYPEEVRRATAYRDEARARMQYLKKGARTEEIEAATARLATAQALEALRRYQVEQIETLVRSRVESPLELKVIQTELLAQENAVREARLRLQQLEAGPTNDQIEQAKQELEAREAALALVTARREEMPILEAQLAIRNAELAEAKTTLKRARARLHEVDVAKERIAAAEAELQRAAADVTGREAILSRMNIVSPVTGTVILIVAQEGEVCRKGMPTIVVTDDSKGRWIEGYVREDDASLVQVGQPAKVELVIGSGRYVEAKVVAMGLSTLALSRAEREGRPGRSFTELVWVKLQPFGEMPNVMPGYSARANIRIRAAAAPEE